MSASVRSAPAQPESPIGCFVIVTINGRYLAFEAESVTGVVTDKELERGGDPKMHQPGDLTIQPNSSGIPTAHNMPVVVLADRGTECHIRVSYVHGRLNIPSSQILPLPAQFRNRERQWYSGMILLENSVAFILNPTWVFEEYVGSNASTEPGSPCPLKGTWGHDTRDGRVC